MEYTNSDTSTGSITLTPAQQHEADYEAYIKSRKIADKFHNKYNKSKSNPDRMDYMKKYLSDTAGRSNFNTFMRNHSLNFRDALEQYYGNKGK